MDQLLLRYVIFFITGVKCISKCLIYANSPSKEKLLVFFTKILAMYWFIWFELEKKEIPTIIINVALGCNFPLFKYTLGDIKSDLKLFNKHTP